MSATTIPPVVLAADGTPASGGALRYAVQEAVARHAGLRIVHVLPMDTPIPPVLPFSWLGPVPTLHASSAAELTAHAEGVMARAAEQAADLAPGLVVSTTLVRGSRVRGIVESTGDAQLVVVGRETQHGVDRLLTGATTAGVTSNARCPVVVVPADWSRGAAADPRSGTVVVGIRSAEDVADLMPTAYDVATSRGAPIRIVHAWRLPDPYLDRLETRHYADEWQALGERLLEEALADWRDQHPNAWVETRVIHGHPASVLVAATGAGDLVIVRRAHEHRPFDHLGSTVRALLLASPGPVEVVPAHLGSGKDPELVLEESGGIAK